MTLTVSERAKACMDVGTRRDLELLEAVADDAHITQRGMASRLGIALGLTNIYLKRLVRKGFIKCVNVKPYRILYLITPQGIAEKTRLTYEFMEYSLQLYGEVRRHLRDVLVPLARNGSARIAIYGTGEAAELAYLSLKELGIEPVAIYGDPAEERFLGMTVLDLPHESDEEFDYLLFASLENPHGMIVSPGLEAVSKDKVLYLRPLEALTGTPATREAFNEKLHN